MGINEINETILNLYTKKNKSYRKIRKIKKIIILSYENEI